MENNVNAPTLDESQRVATSPLKSASSWDWVSFVKLGFFGIVIAVATAWCTGQYREFDLAFQRAAVPAATDRPVFDEWLQVCEENGYRFHAKVDAQYSPPEPSYQGDCWLSLPVDGAQRGSVDRAEIWCYNDFSHQYDYFGGWSAPMEFATDVQDGRSACPWRHDDARAEICVPFGRRG